MPEGRLVRVDGRGELFARLHRHPDPDAPVVLLLHGWTASIDLQFVTAYEALAARYTFVGIDHRGHGRGLRTPDRVHARGRRRRRRRAACASSASAR